MRIGLLTGGGDCPGLNAVIAAVVKKGILHYEDEFVGFLEGWRGVLENMAIPLTLEKVDGIITLGGTILPGVMRDSIIELLQAQKKNLKVEERASHIPGPPQ